MYQFSVIKGDKIRAFCEEAGRNVEVYIQETVQEWYDAKAVLFLKGNVFRGTVSEDDCGFFFTPNINFDPVKWEKFVDIVGNKQ